MKFLFYNPYAVYIHDTPNAYKFRLPQRFFSSGCVRVEKADELAVLLLRVGAGWRRADYQRALQSGKTTRIRLDNPVPLHLVSRTVWVDEDGTVQFRNDPYETETPNTDKTESNNSA